MRIPVIVALCGALFLFSLARAAENPPQREEEELAMRDVAGTIREVETVRDEGGAEWIEAVVIPGTGPPVRVRLAPPKVLQDSEFRLAPGDAVRVRFFTDREPAPVQRIRNQSTGRVLRLRCLHGGTLWERPGEHGGHGPGGPPGGRGGPRQGPGGPH